MLTFPVPVHMKSAVFRDFSTARCHLSLPWYYGSLVDTIQVAWLFCLKLGRVKMEK